MENKLASPVYSLVHASPIFTYRNARDPLSPSHYSSAESVTPKGIPTPRKNPPNPLLYIPADPDSDPTSSYFSSSESSHSSDDNYYKLI